MSGKAERRTKSCGVGARFRKFSDATMWAKIGADVTGGAWLVRHVGDEWQAVSPTEQRRERQLQDA